MYTYTKHMYYIQHIKTNLGHIVVLLIHTLMHKIYCYVLAHTFSTAKNDFVLSIGTLIKLTLCP